MRRVRISSQLRKIRICRSSGSSRACCSYDSGDRVTARVRPTECIFVARRKPRETRDVRGAVFAITNHHRPDGFAKRSSFKHESRTVIGLRQIEFTSDISFVGRPPRFSGPLCAETSRLKTVKYITHERGVCFVCSTRLFWIDFVCTTRHDDGYRN